MGVSKKVIVLIIFSLLILPILPTSVSTDETQTRGSTRQSDGHDVRFFFHSDNTMDTEPPTTPAQNAYLNDGEEIEFRLTPALFGNLEAYGREIEPGAYGFDVDIQIDNYATGASTITFKVFDDATLVAKLENYYFGPGSEESKFEVKFENPTAEKIIFDNEIVVKINASVSGTGLVWLELDTDSNNGYLALYCQPVTSITLGAYDFDDNAGEFYPNWPDSSKRVITFKGDIVDTIGAYDIELVQIEVVGLSDPNLLTAEYTYDANSDTGHYRYDWDYDSGIPPGKKIYNVYITDNTGHPYERSDTFTMADYGVFLECTNNSKYGYPGDDVPYLIDVYNIGGKTDSFSLNAESIPSTWTPSLSKGTTKSLTGDEKETITLSVSIPETASENDECTTTVTATSNNDNNQKDHIETLTVAKAIYSFILDVDKNSDNIDPGDSTLFTFTITNDGDGEDTYDIFYEDDEPSGWDYKLAISGDSIEIEPDKHYQVILDGGDSITALLTVSTSVNPSVNTVTITLKVESENITDIGDKVKSELITVTTETGPPAPLTLTSTPTVRTADPQSSIEPSKLMDVYFDLNLENTAVTTDYNVTIGTVLPTPSGWKFEFSQESFSMGAGSTKSVQLTVSLPERTMYQEEGYKFSVEADYDSQTTSPLELVVKIEELVDAEVETLETAKTIDWEASADYQITIKNIGNVKNEKLEIMYSGLPDGWKVELSTTSVTLGDFNSTRTVTITITPPDDVKADEEANVEVFVETKEGDQVGDSITLSTTVEKDFSAELGNFFNEFWIILIFVVVIIIVTAVVYKRMK